MNHGELSRFLTRMMLLSFILGIVACHPTTKFVSHDKIKIVATTGMLADLAQNIGGDQVEVIALMGSGVDPHLYRPTAGDVNRISQADLIIFGGLHLEGRMGHVFESLAKKSLDVGHSMPHDEIIFHAEQSDPHVWHDPILWKTATQTVADRLSEVRPAQAEQFQQSAANYIDRLDELHRESEQLISQIPPTSRVIVTAHDAFTYFGR